MFSLPRILNNYTPYFSIRAPPGLLYVTFFIFVIQEVLWITLLLITR